VPKFVGVAGWFQIEKAGELRVAFPRVPRDPSTPLRGWLWDTRRLRSVARLSNEDQHFIL
jgi:hypothetical protein